MGGAFAADPSDMEAASTVAGTLAVLATVATAAAISLRSASDDGDDGIGAELAAADRAARGAEAYFAMVLPADPELAVEATDTFRALALAWKFAFTPPGSRNWELPLLASARALLLAGAWEASGGALLAPITAVTFPLVDRYLLKQTSPSEEDLLPFWMFQRPASWRALGGRTAGVRALAFLPPQVLLPCRYFAWRVGEARAA